MPRHFNPMDTGEIDCNVCGEFVPEEETIACASCGMPACSDCQVDDKCSDCADSDDDAP